MMMNFLLIGMLALSPMQENNTEEGILVTEGRCVSIHENPDGTFGVDQHPDLHVLDLQLTEEPFNFPFRANTLIVVCARNIPVPLPTDYKVLVAGYDFMMSTQDGRELVLNLQEGVITYTMSRGELDGSEQEWVDGIVEQMQEQISGISGE